MNNIKDDFNIVWYTLCWNEMPLLPFIIDYWKLIAKKVIVYDNGSTDGTLEYLSTFDWIEVRHYDTNNTIKDEVYIQIKNDCWKEQRNKNVDFVIVSDLDEIIWAKDLYDQLHQFKANKNAIIKPQGYDIISREFPTHNNQILLHEQLKKCCRFQGLDKCILFQPDLVNETNYVIGAHTCNPSIKECANQLTSTELFLFHFKFLGLEYNIMKRISLRNRLSENNIKHGWGIHYTFTKEQVINEFNSRWNNSINISDLLKNTKNDEKIIITLTSWKKRILNIPTVLESIQNQTIKPYKIVLNLSSDEFENKEGDIPVEVLDYIRAHDNIQINWIVKNIKSWKKTIPTFKLYPNDCIICIDDDMLYPNDFIERLWNKHLEYPNNPITFNVWTWPNGFMQHFGAGSLDKKCFYEDGFEKWLETEITNFSDEDSFMTFMAVRHGNPYISAGKIELQSYNSVEPIFGKDGGKAYYWIANKLNDRFENYIPHKNGGL